MAFKLKFLKPNFTLTYFNSQEHAAICASNIQKGAYIAMNAEKIVKYFFDPTLFDNLSNPTFYPDGVSMLFFQKQSLPRIPGVELWLKIIDNINQKLGEKVLIIGSTTDVSSICKKKLLNTYENIKFISINGYEDDLVYKKLILDEKPRYVFIAMGSPKQEKYISKFQRIHPNAFYMGIGGSLDILSRKATRAPQVLLDLNLEFLYRLFKNPTRIIRQSSLIIFILLYISGRFKKI